jgi:hypothetical protein
MRFANHFASHAAKARALYPASLEDLAGLFCFLLFQDIRASPKKKQKLYVIS